MYNHFINRVVVVVVVVAVVVVVVVVFIITVVDVVVVVVVAGAGVVRKHGPGSRSQNGARCVARVVATAPARLGIAWHRRPPLPHLVCTGAALC